MDKTMERLYEAAAEKEVTGQSALARALGQTPQVVKNWEARGISKNGMLLAQKKLGVSAIWLETGQGEMYSNTPIPFDNNVNLSLKHELHRIPIISWVQAGNWRDIEHYDSDDMEYVQTVKFIEDGFAIRVHGDSMQPEFADGDIIVIDPHAPQDAGCYVVAVHDNQATLKKLVYDGTTPYLKPLNPQYPMLSWDESTRIVGVVKQKIKTY